MILALVGHSQTNDTILPPLYTISHNKDISIVLGYNQGRYGFAEAGVAINHYGTNRHPYSLDYFISNEIKLDRDVLIGPKVGMWLAGGFAIGVSFIYYSNFNKSTMVVRPETGVGIGKGKLLYGYNCYLTRALHGINKHQVALEWCFTVKRLKTTFIQKKLAG